MRLLALFAVCSSPAFAQGYVDLATDQAGTRVAFASALPRPGESVPVPASRVYRFAPDQLETIATAPAQPACIASSAAVTTPLFVPGTNLLAYHERLFCSPRSPPIPISPDYTARLQGFPPLPDLVAGELQFSANGSYAAILTNGFQPGTSRIINLKTGRITELPATQGSQSRYNFASNRHSVSNTGRAVILEDRFPAFAFSYNARPAVWDGTSLQPLAAARTLTCVIDPLDRYVVCHTVEDLILFDLATNTKRVLEHSSGDNVVLHVSANGERLLLERAGIARVLAMPSGLETHLLLEDAASATISGDGRIAFASSRGGSLWRFDLETRAYEEWLAPAAELQFPAESAVPGSLFTLRGRIADVASTESGAVAATSLAGFEALLDGEPLPMFKVGPRELRVQIPWESNIAPSRRLEIRHQRNPYFLSALGLVAVRPAPLVQFERLSGYFEGPLVAPHADFRGIATPEDPAVPGETLHLYATGLGPVTTGFATTGQRTPLGSHPVVNMPTCQISAPRVNGIPTPVTALPLRYAGLAGALLGLYQLDVTLPAELPTAELGGVTYVNLQCGYSSAPQSFLNLVPVRIPIKP